MPMMAPLMQQMGPLIQQMVQQRTANASVAEPSPNPVPTTTQPQVIHLPYELYFTPNRGVNVMV